MTLTFFAFGTSLAGLTNIETIIDEPPNIFGGGGIPLLPPAKSRALDSSAQRNGKINVPLGISALTIDERIALNTFLFAGQSTAGKLLYASALDEFHFFSPYLVYVDRPYESQDYQLAGSGAWVRDVVLGGYDWRLQYLSKTSDYTITTADHYIKTDNSGGNVTLTFGDLSGFTTDVVYSFEVVTAGNSTLVKASAGDGGATIATLATAGARVDIAKVSGAWKVIKTGSMV